MKINCSNFHYIHWGIQEGRPLLVQFLSLSLPFLTKILSNNRSFAKTQDLRTHPSGKSWIYLSSWIDKPLKSFQWKIIGWHPSSEKSWIRHCNLSNGTSKTNQYHCCTYSIFLVYDLIKLKSYLINCTEMGRLPKVTKIKEILRTLLHSVSLLLKSV